MLKKFNVWRKYILIRLIMIILISLMPIYFVGISIYNWGVNSVKSEVINTKHSQISSYMNDMDKDIQKIKLLQSDCLISEDLNRLAVGHEFLDDYEKSSYMNRLLQQLNAIAYSNTIIKNAKIILPSLQKSISSVDRIQKMSEKDRKDMVLFNNTSYSQLISQYNELCLNAAFPLNYFTGENPPMYSIIVHLSTSEITKNLKQFDYYPESGSLLFGDSRSFLAASTKNAQLNEYILQKFSSGMPENSQKYFSTSIEGRKYIFIFKTSQYMGLTLITYFPENQIFTLLNQYTFWIWLFSIAAIGIIGILTFFIYRYIQKPLRKLIKAFNKLENGDMKFSIKHNYEDEFGNVYEHFNGMVYKLNETIEQVYKQKIMVQRAELKQLQSQINPHFLYNSFFMLHRMIQGRDYECSLQFSEQLGSYFKFITRSAADEVLLQSEVEHAQIYGEIQAMRFSNRIRVKVDPIPSDISNIIVPRLILQPIIENAIEHGLKNVEEDGEVMVSFHKENENVSVTIEDNGEGLSEEKLSMLSRELKSNDMFAESTGIINIHKRISIKFGGASGIRLFHRPGGGLRVVLQIQLPEVETDV